MRILNQTIAQLKSQRMLTTVSIAGTALSLFLIMVVVMLQEVKVLPFAPESNRDRFLHGKMGSITRTDNGNYQSNGPISFETAKLQYGQLTIPEAVTFYTDALSATVQVPGSPAFGSEVKSTDENFWKVFDFTFLSGKPYDKATFEARLPVAVIDKSTAQRLFGSIDVVGREFNLNHTPYSVAGVVKDVSTLAATSYSRIWAPGLTTGEFENTWQNGLMGNIQATILAKSPADFDAIRKEYERRVEEQNKSIEETGWKFITRNRPYTQEQDAVSPWANIEPDLKGARRTRLIIYAILLLVPAINLSSMTESRLNRRIAEIGVRRAFGCKRHTLMGELIAENLIITVVAGVIGWLLSVAFAMLCSSYLFARPYFYEVTTEPTVALTTLINPTTFVIAMGFCFLLNFLSSALPAWRASRTSIINALNRH